MVTEQDVSEMVADDNGMLPTVVVVVSEMPLAGAPFSPFTVLSRAVVMVAVAVAETGVT